MNIEQLYSLYRETFLVDTDTRTIRKGSVFFALKGDNFNGNKFAEEALKKGASYAVVDEEKYKTSDTIFVVDNVLTMLQQLANYHRNQLKIPIIGLTGSNGKTTTKELINTVLLKKYRTVATKGNLNNHIGVPLTLLSMDEDTEIGIVEMGANHHKEIALLSSIAEPDYGYITNFGKAHLEGFGSVEGVIEAKSELYDYLIENNKTIFVNPTDEIQLSKTKNGKKVLFDESIKFKEINPFVKVVFDDITIQSNLIGTYNFNNIATAITIGKYFNVPKQLIKDAIEEYIPSNNRSQIIEKGTNKVILDAYNANPTSMKAALDNFDVLNSLNKVVVLGDMFELGENSKAEHQLLANVVEKMGFQKSILVGNHFYQTKTSCLKFKSFEELKEYLKLNIFENNSILIKGSRGMALERVLDFIN